MTQRKIEYWVIPPEADAEFVAHMEQVVETYAQPYDPTWPLVCMDEQPVQLVKEIRAPMAATRERPRRVDYEYERAGTASVFLFSEPLAAWRQATARARRTKVDWAVEVAGLLEGRYADCPKVTLVCDNLNTHTKGAFYEVFEPVRARELVRRTDHTVHDLLRFPLIQVNRLRGVGNRTRRELTELTRRLAERFPDAAGAPKVPATGSDAEVPAETGQASVDELRRLLLPAGRTAQSRRDTELAAALLGLRGDAVAGSWPSQSDVARALGATPVAVSQTVARSRRRWMKLAALTRLRHDVVEMLAGHENVMTRTELAAALLARRGSVQEEPLRSCHAGACVRAGVEVERHLAAPRWTVRPIDGPAGVLLARNAIDDSGETRIDGQKLADFAQRLGRAADGLSAADPLLSPARALDALQAVAAPAGVAPLAPNRLLALAAAVSQNAALSSRLELYPRGMAAERVLRLALGALAGARNLTPEEVRRRVAGRYPEAAPLPDRPELDTLLRDAGSELCWASDADDGRGAYRSQLRRFVTIGSATSYTHASHGTPRVAEAGPAEWGDNDAFDERLRRALQNRAFLALTVSPRRLADAERALASAFAIDARSADELLIRHMKAADDEAGADWRIVLRADREPRGSADWATLMRLVSHRVLPRVRAELAAAPRPVLLTNLGLLARYDQMTFLDGLRDAAGRPDGPPGVWLLVPSDAQESRPMVDGRPVPVFTAAQWARIPVAWLAARRPAPLRNPSSSPDERHDC